MPYTRLTVIGTTRKADLVLPDDEPLGALLPQLLSVLDEQLPGGREVRLTTLAGHPLEAGSSIADQGLAHGSLIRLTALDDAPPPADVVDITDAVAAANGTRRDRWTQLATTVALALLAAATAAAAVGIALTSTELLGRGAALPLGVLGLIVGAAVAAHRGQTRVSAVLAAAAGGASTALSLALSASWLLDVRAVLVAGGLWLIVGVVLGVGTKRRSALAGSLLGIGAAVVAVLTTLGHWPHHPALIGTALVCLAGIGLLPGLGLALSGLTRYDDAAIGGQPPAHHDVQAAIQEGFATLTWAVVALALPTCCALIGLVSLGTAWDLALALVTAVVVLLRARIFPLVPQRFALLAAGLGTLLFALTTVPLSDGYRLGLAGASCLIVLGLAAARPSEVTGAKLRRFADVAELLLVVVTVPLALGALGIFADLLQVFR